MRRKYSPEFKVRALQLIEERIRAEQSSGWVACAAAGEALGGISPHPLRTWCKHNRVDHGEVFGFSTSKDAELQRPRRGNLGLPRANESLRKASALLRSETRGRPQRDDRVHRRTP